MSSCHSGRGSVQTRWLAALFGVAVILNYPWELAQSPLYAGMENLRKMWWHCLAASLGDGLIVLLIYVLGWVMLRQRDWFERPGVRGYALMSVAGLAIAISIEWVAVHVAGRWEYTPQMPVLPGLCVGLAPIAQMLMLPPLIFRVVAAWRGRHVDES